MFQRLPGLVQDGEGAFDHLAHHVAPVGDADGLKLFLGDRHAIEANKPEKSGTHDVAAGPVVGVHQDDLGEYVAKPARVPGLLVPVPQPDQVLGEFDPARIARAGLPSLDNFEALFAKASEDAGRGDRREPRGTGLMRGRGEHGGSDAADVVVAQEASSRRDRSIGRARTILDICVISMVSGSGDQEAILAGLPW